jgi:hypothetical protein
VTVRCSFLSMVLYVRRAIGSHACSLAASMRVIKIVRHTCAAFKSVTLTMNSVTTLMPSHVCCLQVSNTNHELWHHTDAVTRVLPSSQ